MMLLKLQREVLQHTAFAVFFCIGLFATDLFMSNRPLERSVRSAERVEFDALQPKAAHSQAVPTRVANSTGSKTSSYSRPIGGSAAGSAGPFLGLFLDRARELFGNGVTDFLQWTVPERGRGRVAISPAVLVARGRLSLASWMGGPAGGVSSRPAADGVPIESQNQTQFRSSKDDDPALAAKIAAIRELENRRIAIIEKVKPAVVAIFGLERQGGGSGVLIHPSGLALTNFHVIQATGARGVGGLADGKLYDWELVGNDPGGDLALIQLRPANGEANFPFVALGDSDSVSVGDWTLVMGNPFTLAEDYQPTVTFGIVSGIERYQPGMADTLLVYGNCIQVDTSINPGNSGGPLFDMAGRLIGINGRASFEFKKRGRVNVGLGYAISVNQCRNFLPELMATKLIQHGTLDAVFEDREGQVVCAAIFEDAEIGGLGLGLGDQLLEFEGKAIQSANQFTNLICTLPAGWPVRLKIRKKDSAEETLISTRLIGLPYPQVQGPPPSVDPEIPKPNGPDGKAQPKAAQPEPESQLPDPPPAPSLEVPSEMPGEMPSEPSLQERIAQSQADLGKFMTAPAGTVQNRELNQVSAQIWLDRWQQNLASNRSEFAKKQWQIAETWSKDDKAVGTWVLTIQADASFVAEMQWLDGQKFGAWDGFAFDGKQLSVATRQDDLSLGWQVVSADEFTASVFGSQALMLCSLVHPSVMQNVLGPPRLSGVDKVNAQISVRLEFGDDASFYTWVSLDDWTAAPTAKLLKTGQDINGRYGLGAVRYDQWVKHSLGWWPQQRQVVSGLLEDPVIAVVTDTCQPLSDPDARVPADLE